MASIRIHALVTLIRDAAQAGRPCPKNLEICAALRVEGVGHASNLVMEAERAGLILVERGQMKRVVSAPDGSWRTAGTVGSPHWRDMPERAASRSEPAAKPKPAGRVTLPAVSLPAALSTRPKNILRAEELQAPAEVSSGGQGSAIAPLMCEARCGGVEPDRDQSRLRSEARSSCRWPLWGDRERPTHVYCEAERADGSYCTEHADRATGRGTWSERQADALPGLAA